MTLEARRLLPWLPIPALAVLAAWTPPDAGLTTCLFARTTGVACPGCGATRAASAFLQGDWSTAWFYHPLGGLLLVQAVIAWAWWMGVRSGRVQAPSQRFINVVLALNAVALIGVWIARATSGTLPPV